MKTALKEEMVIISIPFAGKFETVIDKNGKIDRSECTSFEEYKLKTNKNLKLINWFEYDILHNEFHSKRLKKISKKEFEIAFLDKTKRAQIIQKRYYVFFTTKVSGLVHLLYVNDKSLHIYYKGAKSIALSDEELWKEIIKETI